MPTNHPYRISPLPPAAPPPPYLENEGVRWGGINMRLDERGKFARRSFSTLDARWIHYPRRSPPSPDVVVCPLPLAVFPTIYISPRPTLPFVSFFSFPSSFLRYGSPGVRDPTCIANEKSRGLARSPRFLPRSSPDHIHALSFVYLLALALTHIRHSRPLIKDTTKEG